MKMLTLLIGGAFALALFYVYRQTKKVSTDERLGGGAPETRIAGDIASGFFTPPSTTDKLPVGPPRLDVTKLFEAGPILQTPIQYVPPAPPVNTVQITPAFKIFDSLKSLNGSGTSSKAPTASANTIFKSLVPAAPLISPPKNSSLTALSFSKSIAKPTVAVTGPTPTKTASLFKW